MGVIERGMLPGLVGERLRVSEGTPIRLGRLPLIGH